MSGHDLPTGVDYALNAIETLKRQQAETEAKRLRNEVLAQSDEVKIDVTFSDDELKRLAGFVVDKLVDAVATGYCPIDCTGKREMTIQDHLIQLARSVQNAREKLK